MSSDGRVVVWESQAGNLIAGGPTRLQVYQRNMTEVAGVQRLGGADRYVVSAAISRDAFAEGVPVAYVASGAGFADALSGSAVAGIRHGPVLLVGKSSIPQAVSDELARLKPKSIVVLGGPNSVDPLVEQAMFAYTGSVTRVGGADRYEVSANLANSIDWAQVGRPPGQPVAFVASGEVFPDALSGSAAAGRLGPVILASKGGFSAPALAALQTAAPKSIVLLGGQATLSDAVMLQSGTVAQTSRIGGADRFAVSASVSEKHFDPGLRTVYVASGAVFPDALSGSAAAALRDAPVLLVQAGSVPEKVAAELDRLDPVRIVVLGGPSSVSDAVVAQLAQYVVAPR
ncbi:cell wall-binding repeat-containing protein [Herbiconiux liukaitaii]|uniref:cell wall-binding repeat-containing protein n=1 Tax=Herbiconiux liukaitaii TaxID=3342799 RepID=UPI0035BB47AA